MVAERDGLHAEGAEQVLGHGVAVDRLGQRLADVDVGEDRARPVDRHVVEVRGRRVVDLHGVDVLGPLQPVDVGPDAHEVDLAVGQGVGLGVAVDLAEDDRVEHGPLSPPLVVAGQRDRLGRRVDRRHLERAGGGERLGLPALVEGLRVIVGRRRVQRGEQALPVDEGRRERDDDLPIVGALGHALDLLVAGGGDDLEVAVLARQRLPLGLEVGFGDRRAVLPDRLRVQLVDDNFLRVGALEHRRGDVVHVDRRLSQGIDDEHARHDRPHHGGAVGQGAVELVQVEVHRKRVDRPDELPAGGEIGPVGGDDVVGARRSLRRRAAFLLRASTAAAGAEEQEAQHDGDSLTLGDLHGRTPW